MRIYILITNIDPFVVHIYRDGLARFATHEYQPPTEENRDDLRVHLTNFAINAAENKQILYLKNNMSSKWLYTDLIKYLSKHKELFNVSNDKYGIANMSEE